MQVHRKTVETWPWHSVAGEQPPAVAAIERTSIERIAPTAPRSTHPWGRFAMAAVAGATFALSACNDNATQGAAAIQDFQPADPHLVVPAAPVAGAPAYPQAPRFYALPAAQGEIALDKARREGRDGIPSMGLVTGRDFTTKELADLYVIMDAIRPLWRCQNAPLTTFVRTDKLFHENKVTRKVIGLAFPGDDAPVALSDTSHVGSFRGTVSHEVTHKLLQGADPRTCENYLDHYENPLVKEWMVRMGWKDRQTLDAPRIPGRMSREAPPTRYGRKNPLEDMADSFSWYLGRRDELRRVSPARVAFFDELYAKLGEKPPAPIAMHKAPFVCTWMPRADFCG